MEELIAGIIFFVGGISIIGIGINWISLHTSNIAEHIWNWKELSGLILFLGYLAVIYLLTNKVFAEAALNDPVQPKISALGSTARHFARSVVFFIVTLIIWHRSQLLLDAIHYREQHEWAQIGLAIGFGLIFAFFPTSSLISMTYSAILAQIRLLYLFVASIISLVITAGVALFIILVPVCIYFGLGYITLQLTGGAFNPSNTTHVIVFVGAIAVFIMTIRHIWNYCTHMLNTYANGIFTQGQRRLSSWRTYCQHIYTPASRIPLLIGALLGGDIS